MDVSDEIVLALSQLQSQVETVQAENQQLALTVETLSSEELNADMNALKQQLEFALVSAIKLQKENADFRLLTDQIVNNINNSPILGIRIDNAIPF